MSRGGISTKLHLRAGRGRPRLRPDQIVGDKGCSSRLK